MEIREALIKQAPSLALQRAATDEIARLDAEVRHYRAYIQGYDPELLNNFDTLAAKVAEVAPA